jgi:hypothetical protein
MYPIRAGGVGNPVVVGVAEVVDREPVGRRHVGRRERLDRQDHDPLAQRVEPVDARTHDERRRRLRAVEEHGGARRPDDRRRGLADVVDEVAQRPLLAVTPISTGSHAPWTSFVRFAARKSRSTVSRKPAPIATSHSGCSHWWRTT